MDVIWRLTWLDRAGKKVGEGIANTREAFEWKLKRSMAPDGARQAVLTGPGYTALWERSRATGTWVEKRVTKT